MITTQTTAQYKNSKNSWTVGILQKMDWFWDRHADTVVICVDDLDPVYNAEIRKLSPSAIKHWVWNTLKEACTVGSNANIDPPTIVIRNTKSYESRGFAPVCMGVCAYDNMPGIVCADRNIYNTKLIIMHNRIDVQLAYNIVHERRKKKGQPLPTGSLPYTFTP